MSKRTVLTSILMVLLMPLIVAAAGGRLCFTRGDYIFVREPNGRIRRFVKGYDPSISPDGRTIAFVAIKGDPRNFDSHVKLIDIQTGKLRGIPALDAFLSFSPVWSPNGQRLAVGLIMNDKAAFATVDVR